MKIANLFDKDCCQYCGSRYGIEKHHIIKRSERPDLIDDPENKVKLCWKCHNKTEHSDKFYRQIQRIFLKDSYLKKIKYTGCIKKTKLHQKLFEELKKKF